MTNLRNSHTFPKKGMSLGINRQNSRKNNEVFYQIREFIVPVGRIENGKTLKLSPISLLLRSRMKHSSLKTREDQATRRDLLWPPND